ncbi:MAG: hypothetical protein IJF94_05175 [Eubacterium sp.]|nr:hypothetical protein [Eubacterium sp.]
MEKYTVHIENIVTGEKSLKTITENQLDENILNAFDISTESDFEDIFLTDRSYMVYGKMPYVLVDGKLQWDVQFRDVTVRQFINTYNIVDGKINVKTGYPAVSGAGLAMVDDVWNCFLNDILPAIISICEIINATDVIKRSFVSLRNKLKKEQNKDVFPDAITDAIYRKNAWNHYELSEELDNEVEDAKNLLKGLGYSWDRTRLLFVISDDDKKERIKKFSKLVEMKNKTGYSR